MKFEGTLEIRAPRDRVWSFVIDPSTSRTISAAPLLSRLQRLQRLKRLSTSSRSPS